MNYKMEFLKGLNETLLKKEDPKVRAEIAEVIRILTEKTLYEAAFYDLYTLVVYTPFSLTEAYRIPEIHQAFFDKIRDPDNGLPKRNQIIDIVYCFTKRLPSEEFVKDPQFIPFIESLNFEQCDNLFAQESTSPLLNDPVYYNIIAQKALSDEKFYDILPYNDLSIADGNYKKIILYDQKGLKLLNTNSKYHCIVLDELANLDEITFNIFFDKYATLDQTVQHHIINNPKLCEKLIKCYARNKYDIARLPISLESSIITQGLNYIAKLSYTEKCNFISKLQDGEYQKYLIQRLNILKNILSMNGYVDFLSSIKDDTFLAECLSDKGILNDISTNRLSDLIALLSKEARKVLTQSENFQNYFAQLRDFEKIEIIAACGEETIDKVLTTYTEPSISDYVKFFLSTGNHKYFTEIIKYINSIIESPTEEGLYEIRVFIHTINRRELLERMNDEEFEFYKSLYQYKELTHSTIKNDLEDAKAPRALTQKEQEIIESISPDNPLTKEQIDALYQVRQNILDQEKLLIALNSAKSINERFITNFNYSVLETLNPDDQRIFLDHITYSCLLEHIASCNILVDYCTELYEKDPHVFDNITIVPQSYVNHTGYNLDESSLQKLISLYNQMTPENQAKIINESLLKNEDIARRVRERISRNQNFYSGTIYKRVLSNFLTDEEFKEVLKSLDVEILIDYVETIFFDKDTPKFEDEIILSRQDEIINKIKSYEATDYSGPLHTNIIRKLLKLAPDMEQVLGKFSTKMILEQYKEFPTDDLELRKNQYVLNFLKDNPKVLLSINKITVKDILSRLKYEDLTELISNFNIDEIIELFIKTQNTELEEKIIIEFNKRPYFLNNTDKTIEDILSRLEDTYKNTIYESISAQFAELSIPFNVKEKLRKSSLDEKMFLIYGIKENILTDEHLEYISNLLDKNPFALNSLKIDLFKPEIFNISKNIIPKIYRYQTLTNDYIYVLQKKDTKSKIMLLLLEYLNKTTKDPDAFDFKMNCLIKFLANYNRELINNFNLENISEEELKALEEYIMFNTTTYWVNGLPWIKSYKDHTVEEKNLETFIDYETNRTHQLDEKMNSLDDITEIKDCLFQKYFKLTLEQVELILRKYDTSISSITEYITNQDTLKYYNELKSIYHNKDKTQLQKLYYESLTKYDLDEVIALFNEFNKAYNISIANSIKGYSNGEKTTINIGTAEAPNNISVIEVINGFELIVHSTDAYGSMAIINDDYFDSWNYSERTDNHGICASYISASNLGTAAVKGKGVMFGFTKLNEKSISVMAPYDLVSINNDFLTTTHKPAMFTDIKSLTDYTRHTHNELVLERRNVSAESEYSVIQPDCIIIYEEMTPEIKANAIKAQADFAKHGFELPIIYINRRKIVELEAQRINEMLNIFESNPNLELLAEIINKYESNICGLDFEENLNVSEIFDKERIYNAIINTINHIKNTQDSHSAKLLVELIEHENHKFKLIIDHNPDRAHRFDLLDENLLKELEHLKTNLITNDQTVESKLSF